MTWTLDRLKKTGMLDRLSEDGMVRLKEIMNDGTWENWTQANSHFTPFPELNKELVDALITKWEKTGLLEGITEERPRWLMSQLLENQTAYLKHAQENKCSLPKDELEMLLSWALPVTRRAFATLIHLPSFGVMDLPVSVDKNGRPIIAVTRTMKTIFLPDQYKREDCYYGIDREAEICTMLGDYTKWEISDIVLENTLQNVDTYWYVPFAGAHLVTDPQTGIRRIGFVTRYAASATEKSHEND